MIFRLLVLVIAVFISQACTTNNSIAKEQNSSKNNISTEPASEIKIGENISSQVNKLNLQEPNGKIKNLKTYINNKDVVLIFVKPGCVFCESFEAVFDSTKPKIRPSVIMIMDSAHATLTNVNDAKKKHPNIKATWLFDHENKFKDHLGVQAFPKFIYLNKTGRVQRIENGLIVPENQEELKTLPFAEVLQKISINTINWLTTL